MQVTKAEVIYGAVEVKDGKRHPVPIRGVRRDLNYSHLRRRK